MVNRKGGPILYLDLSSIGKYTAQKKKTTNRGLLFEEIVGYDASVSVSVQLCKQALSKPS